MKSACTKFLPRVPISTVREKSGIYLLKDSGSFSGRESWSDTDIPSLFISELSSNLSISAIVRLNSLRDRRVVGVQVDVRLSGHNSLVTFSV